MILPIEKGNIKITSKYGERSLYGTVGFHSGLDIVGTSSDNIVSVTNGTKRKERTVCQSFSILTCNYAQTNQRHSLHNALESLFYIIIALF
jgi:hypothetical protein